MPYYWHYIEYESIMKIKLSHSFIPPPLTFQKCQIMSEYSPPKLINMTATNRKIEERKKKETNQNSSLIAYLVFTICVQAKSLWKNQLQEIQ